MDIIEMLVYGTPDVDGYGDLRIEEKTAIPGGEESQAVLKRRVKVEDAPTSEDPHRILRASEASDAHASSTASTREEMAMAEQGDRNIGTAPREVRQPRLAWGDVLALMDEDPRRYFPDKEVRRLRSAAEQVVRENSTSLNV